jgi:hypothetical protein
MSSRKQQKLDKRGDRVETLDDPKIFAAIDSDHTKVSYLKDIVKRDFDTWYNWFKAHPHDTIKPLKDRTDMTWVGQFAQEMTEWVKQKYSGLKPDGTPFKPNTLKIKLNSLAWVLLTLDKNKFKEITRPLWTQALKIGCRRGPEGRERDDRGREEELDLLR